MKNENEDFILIGETASEDFVLIGDMKEDDFELLGEVEKQSFTEKFFNGVKSARSYVEATCKEAYLEVQEDLRKAEEKRLQNNLMKAQDALIKDFSYVHLVDLSKAGQEYAKHCVSTWSK